MVGPSSILSSSATPTQKTVSNQHSAPTTATIGRTSFDKDGLQPLIQTSSARTMSNNPYGARGSSMAGSPAPGSFSTDLRSQMAPSRAGSRLDMISTIAAEKREEDEAQESDRKVGALRDKLNREVKIKEGSENMLEALNSKKAKQTKEQRQRVEAELKSSSQRISDLKNQIQELQRQKQPPTPGMTNRSRIAGLFQSNGIRSPSAGPRSAEESDTDSPTESPTYALAEILQALEVEGLNADYYVNNANNLVELFKRHPSLKYDLVWSVFGLRMQVMLLSDSREVVAAAYRMTRHAISDLSSLQKIQSLNTDILVILSLIKERKADVEREQALKFVRAFLEVKDGVKQISRGVVRTIAAVAEHGEDRLRSICIETLAEILIRHPALLISAGGMRPLTDALGEGTYEASEGLSGSILYLLDTPERRKYLRGGYELEVLFTPFTDSLFAREKVLKQNAKAIAAAMRCWSGIMTLTMHDFRAVKSLMSALMLPNPSIRDVIIDLIFGLLRIKPPSWSVSFLAGRRLTTYGRVSNLKTTSTPKATATQATTEEEIGENSLVDHYTALLLAILISSDMLPALLQLTKVVENPTLKRKITLLIGEVLKLADKLLPYSWSSELQLLPELFAAASNYKADDRYGATGTVYQIDSVSRTLYRTAPAPSSALVKSSSDGSSENLPSLEEKANAAAAAVTSTSYDEPAFRQMQIDSGVLNHNNYLKWNWDIILKIIEGPLLNGKRLDEAVKASKFLKRITSFYRPFKYRFSEISNTRANQKYVKVGCALMNTLLQTMEGVKFLADDKLLRQISECLAQCDPTSGITALSPMFSQAHVAETLCCGYFAMMGKLSSDPRGLQILDRWHVMNMVYHIVDDKQRPDLIKLFLSNFDYSLMGHPRVLLSKAMTAGTKEIRIHATDCLRKCTGSRGPRKPGTNSDNIEDSKWAIQLLVTQLYDPEIDVCATAIRILEEACSRKSFLEYIVQCRPALDHLGEIGAPLLLRFLSTSTGYHYLDDLDYISNEMDDWFLGRNDSYVSTIEAALARAFSGDADSSSYENTRGSLDEDYSTFPPGGMFETSTGPFDTESSRVPSHFYRELARTKEGCKLLRRKGHFNDFAATIKEHGMQTADPELVVKVKACLWAVGNVGAMTLGSPFLDESGIVPYIIRIAEGHEIMSVRGTAFFVLGLISRSALGLEILSEHGWDSKINELGESLGLCLPNRLGQLLSFKAWKTEPIHELAYNTPSHIRTVQQANYDKDPVAQRVLELVRDLGNRILAKKAMVELGNIKATRPGCFKDVGLFRKVMVLLEGGRFLLAVRRGVVDLFERGVLRECVLDEEDDESSGEEEGRVRSFSEPNPKVKGMGGRRIRS